MAVIIILCCVLLFACASTNTKTIYYWERRVKELGKRGKENKHIVNPPHYKPSGDSISNCITQRYRFMYKFYNKQNRLKREK